MTLLQTYSLYRTKEAENWAIFSNYITASLPEVGWNLWNYVKLCWPHFKWKFHETEFQQEWTRWRNLIQSKQLPPNLLKVSDNKSKGERENRKGRSLTLKKIADFSFALGRKCSSVWILVAVLPDSIIYLLSLILEMNCKGCWGWRKRFNQRRHCYNHKSIHFVWNHWTKCTKIQI